MKYFVVWIFFSLLIGLVWNDRGHVGHASAPSCQSPFQQLAILSMTYGVPVFLYTTIWSRDEIPSNLGGPDANQNPRNVAGVTGRPRFHHATTEKRHRQTRPAHTKSACRKESCFVSGHARPCLSEHRRTTRRTRNGLRVNSFERIPLV